MPQIALTSEVGEDYVVLPGEGRRNYGLEKATARGSTRAASKAFVKVSAAFAIAGILVLAIFLPIYFEVIVPNEDNEVIVPPVPDSERFDCIPQGGDSVSETECYRRGCVWMAPTDRQAAPTCFYPASDENDYVVSSEEPTSSGFVVKLSRRGSAETPYGAAFANLDVIVTRVTRQKVRIKIVPSDESEVRYEVPFEHEQAESFPVSEALYTVNSYTTESGKFGLQVRRRSTDKKLFDSSVGKMIFADQMLQISTLLASEYVYGFGEHMHDSFLHELNAWKKYGMFSRDQGVGPNANLYGVHPFHMTMEGDGNAHALLFLNSNAQEVELQPAPALTYRSVGGIFDFYMFLGPEPESVVAQYTETVGRPYMPPYWSLGFQLCRYGYGSLDNLKKVVDRMLAADLPYDVQYTDIDYMDRQLDFTINSTTYSGLEDFVRQLKTDHKMRYIIILDPAISANETSGTYPPYDEGVNQNVFITTQDGDIAYGKVWPDLPGVFVNLTWDWDSQVETFRAHAAFPDFNKNETKEWWSKLTVDFHNRLEFDGLWIDMNEPASFVHGSPDGCPSTQWDNQLPYHPEILGDRLYDKTLCMSSLQQHPMTRQQEKHYNMHSLYGRSQVEPTLDACRKSTGERCIVITRSTFPGSGKYAGHWLGDNTSSWPYLKSSIIGMLEFNLFGIPYIGADICGFFNDATEELCMRWMQLGAFYPFSRNHNGLGYKDQDPAAFSSDFIVATRKVLQTRYRLLPHLYTLFYHAHSKGSTVVRSLMAEFPNDVSTYSVDEQMLLGGHLLISPVLREGSNSVTAYIPFSRWFDFYTGVEVAPSAQGSCIELNAPWDHIPLHVRGGAIIPTQTPAKTTEMQRANNMGILYALNDGSSDASGSLFWDDGNSIETVEKENYLLLEFSGTQETLTSSLIHVGFDDAIVFDHVHVLGVSAEQITRVLVNGLSHSHFTFNSVTKRLEITDLSLPITDAWSITWDDNQHVERFNCLPGKQQEATQTRCESLSCIWDDVNIPGVPSCYFPPDFVSYITDTASSVTQTGEEFYLRKVAAGEFFSTPSERLKVNVEYRSQHQLRIKISDAEAVRYQVPVEVGGVNDEIPTDPMYEVIYEDEPFSFRVIRRSTREVIMDTSVGTLLFEDQFLQLSSKTASTYMYGFGEFEHENYRNDFAWTTQAMFARDEGVKQQANLYGHHPFHLTMEKSTNAHGILFLNSNAMEIELTPLPSITYRTTGGILDFYIFFGPTPEAVIQQYTDAIGRPMMPPYWGLGFQLCKYGYGNITELKTVVNGMIEYDIPYDIQYTDIDYMDRQLDFTVDPVNYPGLSEFVDEMRDDFKLRYVIILDPAISANETDYPTFDEGITSDVFVKDDRGQVLYGNVWPDVPGTTNDNSSDDTRAHVGFPDFFKSETADWWKGNIVRFRNESLQFDSLWIDMNEPTNFIDGKINGGCPADSLYEHPPFLPTITGDYLYSKTICMSSTHVDPSGQKDTELHYNLHSLYGWSQAEPTLNACNEATGARCFVVSRSTYPGAGKFTGHWLGDNTSKWSHLRSSIIGMFEFSLFGFGYTGADICGFFEDAEEEMCLRWSQLGAFYPFSRNHAMLGVKRQDPAAWGDAFAADVRKVLRIRYRLLPYLYTLFHFAHTEGSTVVRPLMHEFPADRSTWENDRQFLWGPALLISPVLEQGKLEIDVYFPDARWFDYYSGMEVTSRGSSVLLPAPRDHINLHLRGGHILIAQEPASRTFYSRLNDFELLVALDDEAKSTGSMYWDDGVSQNTAQIFIKSTFASENNQLYNKIVHDDLDGSENLTLGMITVMGLRYDVTRVLLHDVELTDYEQDSVTKTLKIRLQVSLNKEFLVRWELENEWKRIDCWPDLLSDASRETCEERGCVWKSASSPEVPNCFFAWDEPVHGYKVVTNTSSAEDSYLLKRLPSPILYGDDEISDVRLEVIYETANRLHFKLSDENQPRWEIPDEVVDLSHSRSDRISNKDMAAYSVNITHSPFSIQVHRKDNGETLFDTSIGPMKFADKFLQLSTLLPSSNVYGFGEHNHRRYRQDFNWRRWAIFTRDVAPVDDWNLYGHHTFFMGLGADQPSTAYGVYLHNSNAMDVVLQPNPAITYRITGGVLDFYLFVGNSPEEVIQQYHQLIGLPVMPPYWALGFHLSRWDYGSLDRVKQVVDEMRQAQIPFDVQYGDIDYMDGKKSFTYDRQTYSDLPGFVRSLHEDGMRYVIILDPGIKIEDGYKAYDEGIALDVFIKDPDGKLPLQTEVWPGVTHHPDFTHPNSSTWWSDQCQDFYVSHGVEFDGLWVDMNEPSNFQPDDPEKLAKMNCTGTYNFPPYMPRILYYEVGLHDKTICMDNTQYIDLHYNLHSLYGHTMARATHDAIKRISPEKRGLVLTRSTFAGTGNYSVHWTGDNQSLWPQMRWSISSMLEFTLFGFPFVGADVCGFWFNATAELCQRWMQVGAFYPFSRNHNGAGMIPQHPTAFGDDVTESSRKVLMIRYSILPYMYTQLRGVNVNGGTLARALAHEFPSDSNTWNVDDQFLLGDAFLVTPVLDQGATVVTGYFPAASRWFDFYTGAELRPGGKFVRLDAPLDHINLHVRGGHILPMQAPNVTTSLSRTQPLSLLVALSEAGEAEGRLYWDDGESRNVGEAYSIITFNCTFEKLVTTVEHPAVNLPEVDNLHFNEVKVLGLMSEVTSVFVNGTAHSHFSFNATLRTLTVEELNLPLGQNHDVSWSV